MDGSNDQKPLFSFGKTNDSGNVETEDSDGNKLKFSLNANNNKPKPNFGFTPDKPAFSFGTNSNESNNKPVVAFGDKSTDQTDKPLFNFGSGTSDKPSLFGNSKGSNEKPSFTFGSTPSTEKEDSKPTFNFGGTSTTSDKPSLFANSKDSNDKPSFGFGSASLTEKKDSKPLFSFGDKPTETKNDVSYGFGSNNSEKGNESKPIFNFGNKPTVSDKPLLFDNSNESNGKPSFGFGSIPSTEKEDSKPNFAFGNKPVASDKPSLFGNEKDINEKSFVSFGSKQNENKNESSFSFNNLKQGNESKSAINFGFQKADTGDRPTLDFGSKITQTDAKPLLFGKSDDSNEDAKFSLKTSSEDKSKTEESKPAFNFGINNKESTTESVISDNKNNKNTKENVDDQFLKNYTVPSKEHLIRDNKEGDDIMDISNDEENDEFFDDDNDIDIDIDEKTNLPIRNLYFQSNDKPLINKGEHLNFSLSGKTENGVLFVTESEDQIDKHKDEKNIKMKTELFPFELLPQMDQSTEYREFLKNLYKEFEPILEDKKYKYYLDFEDEDEYMNIGIVSNNKNEKEERKLFLRQLMTFTLNDLNKLIKAKLNNDFNNFNDEWIGNYEQIINVLYLLNALHFGNDDETIILFQQWIERIEIQPTDELLELVFEESDKPYKNNSFWSIYVKKFLLRGSFSSLIDDLKSSQYEELKEEDNELFKLIENFINIIESYDPISFSLNIKKFLNWKKIVVELRESAKDLFVKNVMIHSEILELLNIISGINNSIFENSSSWYECFMGLYLYQMPSKKLIKEYINNILKDDLFENPIPGIDTWDSICIELFKNKILIVISSIESLDKSIGTFLAVLIEAAGLLKEYNNNNNNHDDRVDDIIGKRVNENNISDSIDRMVEDLALTYLSNQELFSIGVGILVKINNERSREILSELLPSYEIKDSDDFEWVLSVCSKLKLSKTMKTIQQIQGERFFNKELIGNALICYAKSESIEKIVSIIWKIFEDTLINRGLNNELFDQLFTNDLSKENAILRQSLSPLYILNQILNSKNDIYDKLWFERLISLFEFKYLPKQYKCGLIMIIYENLNKNIFNIDQLCIIIENLNKYEKELNQEGDDNDDIKIKSNNLYCLLVKSQPNNNEIRYPKTLPGLMKNIRRGIAMDVSFTFLDETLY